MDGVMDTFRTGYDEKIILIMGRKVDYLSADFQLSFWKSSSKIAFFALDTKPFIFLTIREI